jgi:hypothetical protein
MLLLEAANLPRELMSKKKGDAADAQGTGEPDGERADGRLRFFQLGTIRTQRSK